MLKIIFKTLLFCVLFVVALAALSIFGFTTMEHAKTVNGLSDAIQKHAIYISTFRYSIEIIAIIMYPYVVKKLSAKHQITPEAQDKYMRRKYIIIFLILTELLVIHNGLGWFVNWLIGL